MAVRVGQRTIVSCGDGKGNELQFFCGNGDCFRVKLDDLEEKSVWWSAARHVFASASGGEHIPISGSDYRVIRLVGRGGFGSVYKVRQNCLVSPDSSPVSQKYYAMKIIKKGASTKSALRERNAAERARHPFIVQLLCSYQSSRNLYLISDFYGGGSLHYHLRKSKQGYFSEPVVQFWGAEILLALEHLHSNGILYRDLKLENILLDSDGHVGITDFGLSTTHSDDIFAPPTNPSRSGGRIPFRPHDLSLSFSFTPAVGNYVGTPFYLAPEVLKEASTSHTVDLWALGVVLHELLLGDVPFSGTCKDQLFRNILNQPLNLDWNLLMSSAALGEDRTLSADARFVLKGLLERDPSRRLSCRQMKACIFFQKCQLGAVDLKKSGRPPFKPSAH
jgi:serine/threonine protein kinase